MSWLPRLLMLTVLLLPGGGSAREAGAAGELPAVGAGSELTAGGAGSELPAVAAAPRPRAPVLRPETRTALWERSEAFEAAGDFRGAAALRMRILARDPGDVHVLWRTARDLVHDGNSHLDLGDPTAAVASFEVARDFARRARTLDAACGECCLYEFAATARLALSRGLARSLPTVRAAGSTLEQCLVHPPTWRDPLFGEEAANLYYGAAVFFRMLPESRWLRWLGIEGDASRAIEMARRATEVSPGRADYRAELGAALLCHADRKGDATTRSEGLALLHELADSAPSAYPRERARALLSAPGEACASSAHGPVQWQ